MIDQFKTVISRLTTAFQDRSAISAIEYGVLAAFIAVAIIAAVTTLGGDVGNLFETLAGNIANAS